jgi:polysaccharide export outer membrane protein
MMLRWLATILVALSMGACARLDLPAAAAASDYVYKLGAGDKIKITVFGEEALNGEYVIEGSGVISFPLLGKIEAKGMTLDAFRATLETRLGAEYIRDPKITAEIANFRSVYILGEVVSPGEFKFAERMTVYALVAKAGGFTYRADQKSVYIRHENDPLEIRYAMTSGTAVQPGDTIRIGQRLF